MNINDILFRGKRDDIGEWVEGNLVIHHCNHINNIFEATIIYIVNDVYINGEFMGYRYPVIPETVGQYTGLTDNNGNKIFEGDIIKFEACGGDSYSKIGVVTFENGCYGIKFNNYQCFHRIGEVITDYNRDIYFKYFVIGNIYDNGEIF